jgi:quercetin dioxygenase-like cupin family protein
MNKSESVIEVQHRDWSSIPTERIGEGIERQMIWGERLMVCRLRFAPGVVTAVHSHPHEQITIVDRGRVVFTVDGQERIASAGDVLHFPSGIGHGATMLDEEVVLIDIFTPLRDDFLPEAGLPRRRLPAIADAEAGDGVR